MLGAVGRIWATSTDPVAGRAFLDEVPRLARFCELVGDCIKNHLDTEQERRTQRMRTVTDCLDECELLTPEECRIKLESVFHGQISYPLSKPAAVPAWYRDIVQDGLP